MLVNCPVTCNFCAPKDKNICQNRGDDVSCDLAAALGLCLVNPSYNLRFCAGSCRQFIDACRDMENYIEDLEKCNRFATVTDPDFECGMISPLSHVVLPASPLHLKMYRSPRRLSIPEETANPERKRNRNTRRKNNKKRNKNRNKNKNKNNASILNSDSEDLCECPLPRRTSFYGTPRRMPINDCPCPTTVTETPEVDLPEQPPSRVTTVGPYSATETIMAGGGVNDIWGMGSEVASIAALLGGDSGGENQMIDEVTASVTSSDRFIIFGSSVTSTATTTTSATSTVTASTSVVSTSVTTTVGTTSTSDTSTSAATTVGTTSTSDTSTSAATTVGTTSTSDTSTSAATTSMTGVSTTLTASSTSTTVTSTSLTSTTVTSTTATTVSSTSITSTIVTSTTATSTVAYPTNSDIEHWFGFIGMLSMLPIILNIPKEVSNSPPAPPLPAPPAPPLPPPPAPSSPPPPPPGMPKSSMISIEDSSALSASATAPYVPERVPPSSHAFESLPQAPLQASLLNRRISFPYHHVPPSLDLASEIESPTFPPPPLLYSQSLSSPLVPNCKLSDYLQLRRDLDQIVYKHTNQELNPQAIHLLESINYCRYGLTEKIINDTHFGNNTNNMVSPFTSSGISYPALFITNAFDSVNSVNVVEQRSQYKLSCGGSIISPRHILTAAHCFITKRPSVLRLSLLTRTEDSATASNYGVKKISIHPDYDPRFRYSDLAIIELEQKVTYSFGITPYCLPPYKLQLDGRVGIESGWSLQPNDASTHLVNTQVTVKPLNICNSIYEKEGAFLEEYPKGLDATLLCTSTTAERHRCRGDSGGSLITLGEKGHLMEIGVASTSIPCEVDHGYPNIYARTDAFLPWIDRVIYGSCSRSVFSDS